MELQYNINRYGLFAEENMTEAEKTQKKTVITDGQDLAEKASDLRKNGVTDVTVVVNTFNYTRYKESNEGKELQPVIRGINKAVDEGLKIRLNVGLKEGFNDDEVLDFLQLTLMHDYDVVFLPTMDYDKIKAKMPGLHKIEGDFGDVDMYKYLMAKGRIGFLKD
ncbi:MAG: radical SAM protein [Firmicutes bacterium]|nr:radical SAM protein [Bacillota bacterium]